MPQLVDQMATSTLEADEKNLGISYEVIRVEDEIEVLRLLKATFFKVKSSSVQQGELVVAIFIYVRILTYTGPSC